MRSSKILREGIKLNPGNAQLHHDLSLADWLAHQGKSSDAAIERQKQQVCRPFTVRALCRRRKESGCARRRESSTLKQHQRAPCVGRCLKPQSLKSNCRTLAIARADGTRSFLEDVLGLALPLGSNTAVAQMGARLLYSVALQKPPEALPAPIAGTPLGVTSNDVAKQAGLLARSPLAASIRTNIYWRGRDMM